MSRARAFAFGAVALFLLAVGTVAVVLAVGGEQEVPWAEVEREDFIRRVPAEGVLRSARSTPVSVPQRTREPLRISWLAPEGMRVAEGDVIVRFDSSELQKTLDDSESDLAANRLRLDKQRTERQATLGGLDRDIESAEMDLEFAQEFASEDEELYSRVEIVESSIDRELAAERLDHHRASQDTTRRIGATDDELLAIERRKLQMENDRARQGLESLEVRAPDSGILVYQRDWRGETRRVGDTVFPGQPLGEIPNLEIMEAEVFVLEADAGGLEAGRRARVFLESAPDRPVEGTIARVDSLAKPRFRGSPVQYFAVVLQLDATDPEVMKPGQRVRAELFLEQVEDALTMPRQAIYELDDETVVFRWTGAGETGWEPVPVEVVSSGLGRVAVSAEAGALEASDRVALDDPTGEAKVPSETFDEIDAPPPPPAGRGGGIQIIMG